MGKGILFRVVSGGGSAVFLKIIISMVVVVGIAGTSIAEPMDYLHDSRAYPVRVWGKLWRGIGNVTMGFHEFPVNVLKEAKFAEQQGGNIAQISLGYTTGIFTGVGYTVTRMGVGVFDVASFWWPGRRCSNTRLGSVCWIVRAVRVG